ncbi:hypothetical protein KDI_43440 [Dictyobacter arantiisoli]|uniref:LysR substrate-binding domain-containing protein n=2 Tax=Dictyobacter arantiisoli TaxID=2014874 RepID=A0A5A5TGS8_9CHLR|nr:hypothetical protein KDI_43440 [Dictyobacter arantiisoli]
MLLGLVAANLGVSLLPASAMTLYTQGIVYRPLADVNVDIAVETVVVWRREEISPLVQEFLVAIREVLEQQKKTMTGVPEGRDDLMG